MSRLQDLMMHVRSNCELFFQEDTNAVSLFVINNFNHFNYLYFYSDALKPRNYFSLRNFKLQFFCPFILLSKFQKLVQMVQKNFLVFKMLEAAQIEIVM